MTNEQGVSNRAPPTTAPLEKHDEVVLYKDIAHLGNGHDEELSQEQYKIIETLFDLVAPLRTKLVESIPADADFCDYETCRRFLLARQWNLKKAQDQLSATLKWRLAENPSRLKFWQSPKALGNPLALSMRIIGLDKEGRPIAYTCFAEAHDRWDTNANVQHVICVMEASLQILKQRRLEHYNKTASSRQWVWLIDFDGFGLRDQNPKTGFRVAKLILHYPEMLHLCVLLNAPKLFRGVYRVIRPVLDKRVQRKVLFTQTLGSSVRERLGDEATEWIVAETKDNAAKRSNTNPKRYWIPPQQEDEHDARGMASYVISQYYVKTPGDAYEEQNPS